MNDSRDFHDAESIRSGKFPTLPVDQCHSHLIQYLKGCLRHSFITPSRKDGPPSIWDTQGISENVFCISSFAFYSTLSAGIESMEFRHMRTDSLINGGEE